jgi:hypothetical protein
MYIQEISHGNVGGNSNHTTALKLWYSIGYSPFMVGGEGEGLFGEWGGGGYEQRQGKLVR